MQYTSWRRCQEGVYSELLQQPFKARQAIPSMQTLLSTTKQMGTGSSLESTLEQARND